VEAIAAPGRTSARTAALVPKIICEARAGTASEFGKAFVAADLEQFNSRPAIRGFETREVHEVGRFGVYAACSDGRDAGGITSRPLSRPMAVGTRSSRPDKREDGYGRSQVVGNGRDRKPLDSPMLVIRQRDTERRTGWGAAREQHRAELGLPENRVDLTSVERALPPHLLRRRSRRSGSRTATRTAYLAGRGCWTDEVPATAVGKSQSPCDRRQARSALQVVPQALAVSASGAHLAGAVRRPSFRPGWTARSPARSVEPASDKLRGWASKGRPAETSRRGGGGLSPQDAQEQRTFSAKGTKARRSRAWPGTVGGEDADLVPGGCPREVGVQQAHWHSQRCGGSARQPAAEARAMLVGWVVAHVAAFGRSFSLRSGASYGRLGLTWGPLARREDRGERQLEPLGLDAEIGLFRECE